jgi:hypothetical protein
MSYLLCSSYSHKKKDRHCPVFFYSAKPGFMVLQKLNHIYQNPAEEGSIFRAEDCVYRNATDYAGGK